MTSTIPEHSDRIKKSVQRYKRAEQLIPGATQLISRRSYQFAEGISPLYAKRAKGARFWDLDGNEYIDWVSGIRSIILGYCDPVVDEAVKSQIDRGTVFTINHELEIELAEELTQTIPCAEMVRYAKGGGEACAIAVRIARGTTGRDKILFCGYHGWHDWYLSANLNADLSLNEHLFPGIEPIGVPKALAGTARPFPYGDLDTLGELLDRYRGEVAAVIMEPLRSEMPPEGYLEGVQSLTRDRDVILIFDEVSTGFRLSAGGVQPALGITPDMAVFAKSLSNGYSMGAVVGSRNVMEPASNMFISSTYWSDTVGIQAALTTLQEIRKRDIPAHLDRIGAELKSRINAIAEETDAPVTCEGLNVSPKLKFQLDDPEMIAKLSTLYIQEMAKRGCHGYADFCPNGSHGNDEVEQTIESVRGTFTILADAVHNNRIDDLLECLPRKDSFRRMVR